MKEQLEPSTNALCAFSKPMKGGMAYLWPAIYILLTSLQDAYAVPMCTDTTPCNWKTFEISNSVKEFLSMCKSNYL